MAVLVALMSPLVMVSSLMSREGPLRYDSEAGVALAARIAERLRDAAYRASVELAKEKGAFPKLDVESYLADGTFASRLPADIRRAIREHGIRNSHLLSIAPTGTVSLAFADNASNGIEPAFSWTYTRKKREADGSTREHEVADHAWRLWRALGGDVQQLPPHFVSALEMGVDGHLGMMAAVQPFIDTSISKTVNVPADYPFGDFKDLYLKAWRGGLKGLATYRPNDILGSVLSVSGTAPADEPAAVPGDPMRAVIESRPLGALEVLWAPDAPRGQRGAEDLRILAYAPERMLAFEWSAPPQFARARPARTFVVVELEPLAPARTRVVLLHQGFAEQAERMSDAAPEWRDVRAYFESAWPTVLDAQPA